MSGPHRRSVGPSDVGKRLDVFLAGQPELQSRTEAKEWIQTGHVRVDGARGKPGLSLEEGQEVTFEAPAAEKRAGADLGPAPEIPVLFADAYIIAIAKPPGIAVHPPDHRRFRGHTVSGIAAERFGPLPALAGEDRPGIVHRLDKETTGVMVLARTEESFHFLRSQFKARTVHKEYRAISFGAARFDSDWIERSIGPDPRQPDRMAVVPEGGREAITFYEVVERFAGFTHFRCLPKTGRTHQIRVHLMSIGNSLVGDRMYRSRRVQHEDLPTDAPHPGRHCLHAYRLRIKHPCTHEEMDFESPIPADMEGLLRWLREHRAVD